MASTQPIFDKVIMESVAQSEEQVENHLECDVLYYYGELRTGYVQWFRDQIEHLANRPGRRDALGICITTPGGQAESVEKMVEIIRHHYEYFYAIVPNTAMSAGTILCMGADKIYMDYSSSLGPIDPQVPDRDDKFLVPALGYLDKVNELIEKSRKDTITPAEFQMLQSMDLAMLRFYEQQKELSITLLKDWLVRYKFKGWTTHRTTRPGEPVTDTEKEERAEHIAQQLSANNLWHTHGRMIGMQKLREQLRLEIEDFGEDQHIRNAIRRYSDTLTGYVERLGGPLYIFSRHVS